LFLALTVSLGAACGGDFSSEFVGIYTLAEWTENSMGCDAPGDSVLSEQADKAAYVKVNDFFGVNFLSFQMCASVADCKAEAAEVDVAFGGPSFETGDDAAGWTGQTVSAFSAGDDCEGTVTAHALARTGTDGLSVRSERRDAASFPKDSDGFCDTDAAKSAAEGAPCVELTLIEATFAEAL